MTTRKTLMLAALLSIAPAGLVMAQSQTPSTDAPSSASSPHQREVTGSGASESSTTGNVSTTDSSSPAAGSSPHQRQATGMSSKQSMKECVAKQRQESQGMSASDAKKACKQQMKGTG